MLKPVAGVLLLGMWACYLSYLFMGMSPWPATALAWSAALLLGPRLDHAARRMHHFIWDGIPAAFVLLAERCSFFCPAIIPS